ncbi:MAG TPA: hypothetical protein VG345_11830, partial [Bryobacteraceae bacterium]|nr:hypothetical protein [Bryobacteraceae bacterium]
MTHRRFALTSLLPFAFEPTEIGASVSRTIAFRNATVIDGSRAVLPDHTIVIREDRVIGLGPSASTAIPSGTSLVDARGRFIIPGLWDAHAHVSYFKASSLPVLLANGVTSIRDMGGLLGELDRWRTQTDAGLRPGPRIYRAGPILNGKAFNEFQIAVNNSG